MRNAATRAVAKTVVVVIQLVKPPRGLWLGVVMTIQVSNSAAVGHDPEPDSKYAGNDEAVRLPR